MLFVLPRQAKVQPRMGLAAVTWSVDQEFQKFCVCRRWRSRRWRWNDSGRGSLICRRSCRWGSVWETDASELWVTSQVSTVQRYDKPQALDQLEEWMKENPIPYISNDKFSQEGIFDYWAVRLPGHAHVNQTYPVVRMWRQFHGCILCMSDRDTGLLQSSVTWTLR